MDGLLEFGGPLRNKAFLDVGGILWDGFDGCLGDETGKIFYVFVVEIGFGD